MIAKNLERLKSVVYQRKISEFSGNVLKLAGGTAFGQGLVIISTPLITRLYSPSEMGLLGIFLAFVGSISVGVGLRYEIAIVSAKNDREADHLLVASIIFAFPLSLLAGLTLWYLIHHDLLSYGSLPEWSAVVSIVALLLIGFLSPLRYWHARHSNFSTVSRALILQGSGRAVVPVVFALGQTGWIGLLSGEIAGRVFAVIKLIRSALPTIRTTILTMNRVYSCSILKKNWKFPVIVLPASIIDALVVMLPLPVIGFFFGTEAAGQFLLVQRISQLPAGLVSASVGDVFYAHISEAYRSDTQQIRKILWTVVKKLSLLSSLVYIPLAVAAPFVFELFFGHEWSDTGLLVSILAPVGFVGMVVSPVSRVLFVVDRTELKLISDCIRLIVPLGGLWCMYALGYNFLYSVTVFSLLSTLSYMLYLWLVWFVSGDHHQVHKSGL